jgi:phage FluMu protein Com
MYIKTEIEHTTYSRKSKLGQEHTYVRKHQVVTFRCDNCSAMFTRSKGKMDPKRLSNNYFHVCSNCDPKKFAQKKGAERRTIWDKTVNSDLDISRL